MTTRRQPLLVNQFKRLVQTDDPRSYQLGSAWNNVVHGHDYDAENCMASMGAVAAAVQSGFQRRFSPGDIRNHQDDFAGGIGHDDVQVAFARLGLPFFIMPSNTDWADSVKWMREGRWVWWAVNYGLIPHSVRAQKAGSFDHAVGGSHVYSDGTFDLYDPLAHSIQRVTQSSIKPAAEAIALRERGDAGRLFVGATRPLPAIGLVLYPGAVKTKLQPDRMRADGRGGRDVNVHSKPRTGASTVIATISDGSLFRAFQLVEHGDSFEGSTVWYGNQAGDRWISTRRLSHQGGTT